MNEKDLEKLVHDLQASSDLITMIRGLHINGNAVDYMEAYELAKTVMVDSGIPEESEEYREFMKACGFGIN